MKVFLAGGTHSGWQEKVKRAAPQHSYFDPRLDKDERFGFRMVTENFQALENCDLLFVYFEQTNPSGLGLATEMGYAVKAGKPSILVDEHKRIHIALACMCQRLYTDLEEACAYLKAINE